MVDLIEFEYSIAVSTGERKGGRVSLRLRKETQTVVEATPPLPSRLTSGLARMARRPCRYSLKTSRCDWVNTIPVQPTRRRIFRPAVTSRDKKSSQEGSKGRRWERRWRLRPRKPVHQFRIGNFRRSAPGTGQAHGASLRPDVGSRLQMRPSVAKAGSGLSVLNLKCRHH